METALFVIGGIVVVLLVGNLIAWRLYNLRLRHMKLPPGLIPDLEEPPYPTPQAGYNTITIEGHKSALDTVRYVAFIDYNEGKTFSILRNEELPGNRHRYQFFLYSEEGYKYSFESCHLGLRAGHKITITESYTNPDSVV